MSSTLIGGEGEPMEFLLVHDLDGVDFTLSAYNTTALAAVNAEGGMLGYYHAMRVLGADPGDWTTDVVG